MKQLQFQVQVKKIQTMADGGMGLSMHTQEMSNEHKATLLDFGEKLAWATITEAPVDSVVVPDKIVEIDEGKTPSQRQRAILYRLWEHHKKPLKTFEVYYRSQMEKINDHLKSQLPPRTNEEDMY